MLGLMGISVSSYPRRIASLCDEATEFIYLLGQQDRIVGVSGFSRRPPEVRAKPRISTFREADFDAIAQLQPDLIVTYSDVQAEITRAASLRGFPVLNCNQRSVAEIFDTLSMLARILGQESRGQELIDSYRAELERIAAAASAFPVRPRVFFEEWNEPLISGIQWVEELIEIAGGAPVFPEKRCCGKAQDRVVTPEAVIERNPEVIFASWCGMKVDKASIAGRSGWDRISAVRNGNVFEIESSNILQPGPAALTDGVRQIHAILARVAATPA
jgi:iron complex transport system substrate-binding protein